MTRRTAGLRRAQHNLFAAGPAAHARPQAAQPSARGPFVHPCQAPGCGEWGAYGFGDGEGGRRWFCAEHRLAR